MSGTSAAPLSRRRPSRRRCPARHSSRVVVPEATPAVAPGGRNIARTPTRAVAAGSGRVLVGELAQGLVSQGDDARGQQAAEQQDAPPRAERVRAAPEHEQQEDRPGDRRRHARPPVEDGAMRLRTPTRGARRAGDHRSEHRDQPPYSTTAQPIWPRIELRDQPCLARRGSSLGRAERVDGVVADDALRDEHDQADEDERPADRCAASPGARRGRGRARARTCRDTSTSSQALSTWMSLDALLRRRELIGAHHGDDARVRRQPVERRAGEIPRLGAESRRPLRRSRVTSPLPVEIPSPVLSSRTLTSFSARASWRRRTAAGRAAGRAAVDAVRRGPRSAAASGAASRLELRRQLALSARRRRRCRTAR